MIHYFFHSQPIQVARNKIMPFKIFISFGDHITVALIVSLVVLVEMGPEGVIVVHFSRGCYSDVGDARLCRELVEGGGPPTTKSFTARES